MKTITLRNIPPNIERRLERRAREWGLSFNRTVLRLLEGALGVDQRPANDRHHDLDHLAGAWTEQDAAAFDETLRDLRGIDRERWE